MVAKRRGKRKSGSKDLLFEVSDNDVSTDDSETECNEPEKKILKTDSNFIESVVNALSNLENEKKEKETNCSKTEVIEILDESSKGSDKAGNDSDNSLIVIEDRSFVENEDSANQSTQNSECTAPIQEDDTPLVISQTFIESCDSGSPNELEEAGCANKEIIDVEDGEVTSETDSPEPIIQISFSTRSISNVYKQKILDFFSSCTDLRVFKHDDLSIIVKPEEEKANNDWITLDDTGINTIVESSTQEINNVEQSISRSPAKKRKKKKAKKDKDLFVLDTEPSQEQIHTTKYSSKFQIDITKEKENDEKKVRISAQSCFNCDQGHALKDCPLPKNYNKINMKRQQMKMMKEKQSARYHLEEEQKYAHLTPGKISDKLREALGIKRNQLPSYIYQMRGHGYPPGWLEEAKFVYSNLTMFDSDGNNVRAKNVKKNQGLDTEKIIEYPGFNVPMEKHCKDEYRQHHVPPYSNQFSKAAMIEFFEKQYSKQQDDFETQDMDVDDEEHDIAMHRGKALETSVPSPSLVALEKEKLTLLAALDDSSNSNLKSESGETSNIEQTEVDPLPPGIDDSTSEDVTKVPSKLSTSSVLEDSQETPEADVTPINKKVIHSNFGTPILKSCSPYSILPNPDNFMKDVSPVINFENLPNSTGTYEKMVGLLQKVRSTMKKIPKDNS
ncbi:zinc finger CCHC domain-containing protein 8 homolog [Diabrotica virgifera virgifera]|uniref:Zinc finger CCHC domain-containing protein 8 homolog n=1 Tax=Diabrotica virgifera virgifera TaxID=50390 RepID=A0A6P7GFH3_DIAVI|nr:zinc finger CCHC domain-containing protein 8 homolog [Diabrotica virgifera virgifera]